MTYDARVTSIPSDRETQTHTKTWNKMEKGGTPGEGHLEALQDNRLEVEDLGVEVDGAEGARGDDHTLELGKYWLHCQAGIQAAQLQAHHSNEHGIHGRRQQEAKQMGDGREEGRKQGKAGRRTKAVASIAVMRGALESLQRTGLHACQRHRLLSHNVA